jgi:hypothetical protein
MCSRIRWVDDNKLRILNLGNLDCIFEIVDNSKEGKKPDQSNRYLKLISAVKVDNLYENRTKLDSPHMFFERNPLET